MRYSVSQIHCILPAIHDQVYDCNVLHSTLCLMSLNCLSYNFLLGIEFNVKHCNLRYNIKYISHKKSQIVYLKAVQ